jgi:hypothetical protein
MKVSTGVSTRHAGVRAPRRAHTAHAAAIVGVRAARQVHAGLGGCGARTLACRVGTLADARPAIIFSPRNQSRFHRIILDVECNPAPLSLIPDPVIVRFTLPKRLSSSSQKAIRFTSGAALQRFHELAGRHLWQQQHMNMVGHDDEASQLIVSELCSSMQGFDHHLRDGFFAKEHRPGARCPVGGPAKQKPRQPMLCEVAEIGSDERCREGAR